jgi:hypothetical protein
MSGSRFIRLTHYLLNTNDIHQILIQPNVYYICTKKLDGFNWSIAGFGIGWVNSTSSHIKVCETKDQDDYKIVSDWIKKNS